MVRVTDEERREVAERLRGLRRNENSVTQLNHGPTWSLAWCVLGDGLDECGTGDWFERMCARLADLIDPGEFGQNLDRNRDTVQKESPAVQKAPECDREALLALAKEMDRDGRIQRERQKYGGQWFIDGLDVMDYARRIREACGEVAE